ncbi:hypothetical protein [Microbaculum marinum]|uniref:Uncharacterized protein n=1 Tax=Microbaculum marinum TaxID=1764581 RepID=A0AAW9RNK1_9HYPH
MTFRSWCVAIAASAAIAAATTGGAARTSDPASPACGDLQYSRSVLDRMVEDGRAAVLTDLEGETARLWISMLNQYPPRTAYPGDAVIAVVSDTTRGNVMVAIYSEGCELGVGAMPASVYRTISEAVEKRVPQA